jgi:hypothetical protein
MDGVAESYVRTEEAPAPAAPRVRRRKIRARASRPVLGPWLRAQSINVTRHAAALRPFRREEFGPGAAAPSEGHIQAVNSLMGSLRRGLLKMSGRVTKAASIANAKPTTELLSEVMRRKDHAHHWVQGIERIWDFYFELFGQRQSNYADWLLSCDRIALDCYRRLTPALARRARFRRRRRSVICAPALRPPRSAAASGCAGSVARSTPSRLCSYPITG